MTVRALYSAIEIPGAVPPYDRASLKIYYPAKYTDSAEERNSGLVAVDSQLAPFPVLIMLPGINLGPEAYGWLAKEMAELGIVTVTYTLVAEEMPGYISLTPGLSLSALSPDNYAEMPSATALSPIIEQLQRLNSSGVLAGQLQLQKIILGGHSAGGTVALLNARADWFPGVSAAFSYGAHSAAATALGYEQNAMFQLPSQLPTLIIGGTRDGCIANSAARYGEAGSTSPTEKVEQTYDRALSAGRGDNYLMIVQGANHFSLAYPADETTGRPFIDLPTTAPDTEIRSFLAELIGLFIRTEVTAVAGAREQLNALRTSDNPLICRSECK
jgi:dienelactone hydrolase